MTPQLKLVPTPDHHAAGLLAPARFDLRVQATRPGVAYEPTSVTASEAAIAALCQASAHEGLSPEPWAALAIETTRSLKLASRLTGTPENRLAIELDDAAVAPESQRVPAGPGGRLIAYARCLRAAPLRTAESARSPFIVPVPYVAIIAWQHAATESGAKVGEWAASMLKELPIGRAAWEASAAEAGQTVCEWVLSQAASRCSRSSKLAHSAG
jgi:hypothetical protein